MNNSNKFFLVLILGVILGLMSLKPYAISQENQPPYVIPVLVVKYFPVQGDNIDISVTRDWGATLKETQIKTDRLTEEIISALQEGSRYHGYKDASSKPSLEYKVVHTIEFLKPIPTYTKLRHRLPMANYYQIMKDIDIKYWVEEKQIKEDWI